VTLPVRRGKNRSLSGRITIREKGVLYWGTAGPFSELAKRVLRKPEYAKFVCQDSYSGGKRGRETKVYRILDRFEERYIIKRAIWGGVLREKPEGGIKRF